MLGRGGGAAVRASASLLHHSLFFLFPQTKPHTTLPGVLRQSHPQPAPPHHPRRHDAPPAHHAQQQHQAGARQAAGRACRPAECRLPQGLQRQPACMHPLRPVYAAALAACGWGCDTHNMVVAGLVLTHYHHRCGAAPSCTASLALHQPCGSPRLTAALAVQALMPWPRRRLRPPRAC
jgi:hypothetical protein